MDWTIENTYDIVGLVETNISEKEGFFLGKPFKGYHTVWSSACQEKKKGSGVGLIISERWKKHLGFIQRFDEFSLAASFLFKQLEVVIIVLYIPPNDNNKKQVIRRNIIEKYMKRTPNSHFAIMGDFNAIIDQDLDRTPPLQGKKLKIDPLHKWLIKQNFADTFRVLNPITSEFTWSNGHTETRIDQIWVSEMLIGSLHAANIIDMSTCTESDHNSIDMLLDLSSFISKASSASAKRKSQKRTIFLYDEASEDDWENYRAELDKMLKNKETAFQKLSLATRNKKPVLDNLNECWSVLERSIIEAANKAIPKKKLPNVEHIKRQEVRRSRLHKVVVTLSRWLRKAKRKINIMLDSEEKESFNREIRKINKKFQVDIQEVKDKWSENSLEDLKGWWKILKEKNQRELEVATRKEINEKINRRCEMIHNAQGKMIASLLNKPLKKIKLEKLIVKEGLYHTLISEEKQVLEKTRDHFQAQFRQRNIANTLENDTWKEIYSPQKRIQEDWYDDLDKEVAAEEWEDMLCSLRRKSAPGLSGISYTLIKASSSFAQQLFRSFISACIAAGTMPKRWKIAMIYLIPKDCDWNYSLANVRPIALLESFRKCMTRIYTKRLTNILIKRSILRGPNFAGLPGNSTESPIHILNSIIEDAHTKKNELWILLQDMRKAFDSVSLKMLKLALLRLKFPLKEAEFILQLFHNREASIITEFGNTDAFVVPDGIDQGEVISPILWRIFYDPLIEKIQSDPNLGYVIEIKTPSELSSNQIYKQSWRQAVLAYADDTTWIAKDKAQMEKIIHIAEEFFQLNDIQINSSKSKLVIFNSSLNKTLRVLKFGGEEIKEENENQISRFLGVWINSQLKDAYIKAKAKGIVRGTVLNLAPKKLTLSQLSYLNNICIIPKLCYMLQTSRLSKEALKEIHRPMLKLIKNKMELQISTENFILKHKSLGNCRALDEELFAKQTLSLLKRLNSEGAELLTTSIRLKQGLIDARIVNTQRDLMKINNIKSIWKHNLSCLVLLRASELDLFFDLPKELEQMNLPGQPLNLLLGQQFNMKSAKALKSFNLYTTCQLINEEGNKLIPWSQLKLCRKRSRKGRKPKWFEHLENLLLEDTQSRYVKKEFCLENNKIWTIKYILPTLSNDKRKKEWICVNSKMPDEKVDVVKVISKKRESILGEHWKINIQQDSEQIEMTQCTGCDLDKGFKENICTRTIKRSNIAGVLPRGYPKENTRLVDLKESRIAKKARSLLEIIDNHEQRLSSTIQIDTLEIELIKNQGFSTTFSKILQRQFNENLQRENKTLIYYTDGSLSTRKDITQSTKMGIGWVQVNNNKSVQLDEGFAKIKYWPSSTRPELAAIWIVLLLVPRNFKVIVCSDSAAAIAAIERKSKDLAYNKFIKISNFNILDRIKSLVSIKNIELELVKVKGHSEDKWNEKADSLAKKGLTANDDLEVRTTSCVNFSTVLKWKSYVIENPTRSFLNRIRNTIISSELMCSDSIKKVEPETQNCKFSWALLWDKVGEQNGSSCDSLSKSKKLCTIIKSLQGKLPVLKIMVSRFPDLYPDAKCKLCNSGEEESQEHLAYCSIYESRWKLIEESITKILREEINLISKKEKVTEKQVHEVLFGSSDNEIRNTRTYLIRSLVKKRTEEKLSKWCNSQAEARYLLKILLTATWNYFYEDIWKPRCKAILDWEKTLDIARKKKNRYKEKKEKNQESSDKQKKKCKTILHDLEANLSESPKKHEEVDTLWRECIELFISDGINPCWLLS